MTSQYVPVLVDFETSDTFEEALKRAGGSLEEVTTMKWRTDANVHRMLEMMNLRTRFIQVPREYLLADAVSIEDGTVVLNHEHYELWKIKKILRSRKPELDKVKLINSIVFSNRYRTRNPPRGPTTSPSSFVEEVPETAL